jgi:ABC-2 type transport system ATP-binding protein
MNKKPDIAVTVERVSKSFGTFKAVDDISFEVHRGEIFAMLGPNGAGKSTTMRMILDILKPDSGKIEVLGGPLNDRSKDRIGYLPEERGLYRNVKVVDMMAYLGELKGMSGSKARARAMELLTFLGLADVAKKKVNELSKGMQQKVQFAVTVIHEPDMIIVDEPFSGLDPVNTLVVKELVLNLRNRGTAVIMSTHQMSQVEEMADRLLMINRGHQALYGDVDEVRRRYASHAVIVEGTGDWKGLPGVAEVHEINNGRQGVKLFMKDNVTANDLLSQIAASSGHDIDRFELAVPSLTDIFIQVAGAPVEQEPVA